MVDTTAPVITLVGSGSITQEVHTTYTDAGATWTDNIDISGTVTSTGTVNSVNTGITGTYTVTYDYTDTSGNPATQKTRTVKIVDTTPPVITRLGDPVVNIHTGDTYTDAGATANDNYDLDITPSILSTGLPINTSATGSYTVTYDVTDAHGNHATQVTRTVHVSDVEMPVITLLGTTPVTLEVGSIYSDAGATANDNIDGNITSNIVVTGDTVNSSVLKTYTIHYDVTDTSGNHALQITRVVNVVDTTKPVITLTGTATGTILKNTTYTDS